MAEQTTASETAQQDVVKANWDALKNWDVEVVETTTPTKDESEQNKDVVETEKVAEEKPAAESEKTETENTEVNKENLDTDKKITENKSEEAENEELELKPEDIKEVPVEFEDGDWRAVAKDLGFDAKDNSWEDFVAAHKDNFVSKAEHEKVTQISKEAVMSQFKPEIAAAIKLYEMGVPQELIFEPTKEIDAYLKLDAPALVREDLRLKGMTEDLIDAKMESLTEEGKVESTAKLLQFELNKQREHILNTQQNIISQRAAEIERVQKHAKEQELTQLKEALNNTSEFLGAKLTKEAKEIIAKKLQSGAYEKELSSPQAKIAALLQKEFGQKYVDYAKSKARSDGKMEVVKKLANVPPKQNSGIAIEKEPIETGDNWAAAKQGNAWN